MKKSQHHALHTTHSLCLFLPALVENSFLPGGKHPGINVGFPADRGGIAELFSDLSNRRYHAGFEGAFSWELWQWGIQHKFKRPQCRPPCTEILGGKLGTHGLVQVAVYLFRPYPAGFAVLIDKLKKMRALELLAV